ncbi:hypothetical protein C7387_1957 [Yokenella regensburgei]|uniref:Uncharacterized protein n=1 Tax=Yokenella regensburgei TaxID=158877 RepID=A0ABX9S320_9ENTR|nr:hypothetical protein C7387_1957 [Yokenella regensburgei]VFS16985.1 Uncharacterised protein [Yokenella regensburgei]
MQSPAILIVIPLPVSNPTSLSHLPLIFIAGALVSPQFGTYPTV